MRYLVIISSIFLTLACTPSKKAIKKKSFTHCPSFKLANGGHEIHVGGGK